MRNYIDKLRRYFWFSREELKGLALVIAVFAFVFSLSEWIDGGSSVYEIGRSLAVSLVIVAVSVMVHQAGQRLVGIARGFKVETKVWWYGLLICLALGVMSRGKLMFFAATGMWVHHLAVHRLGMFRYGPNVEAMAWIAFAGPAANILFATIVKNIQMYLTFIPLNPEIAEKIFFFNWLFAGINLLPIPPLDGSRLFFMSRLWYAFIAGTIIGYLFLITVGVYSYWLALLIGGATWLIFYIFFERLLS